MALDPADDDLGRVLGDDFIVMEHSEFWRVVSRGVWWFEDEMTYLP